MRDFLSYIKNKSSAGNNKRMWDLLVKFMLVEKWASEESLFYLMANPHATTTQRFLSKMVTFKIFLRDEIYTNGHKKPFIVYRTTHNGFSMMSELGVGHGNYVTKKNAIAVTTLIHSIDLQCLHAILINDGFTQWRRPDYEFKKKGQHYSDAIAVKNGLVVAFELERYVKTPQKYLSLLSYYALEIFEKRLDRVFYVCPTEAVAKSIKKYFESVDVVKCGEHVFNTNDSLFKHFSFVDYAHFGF